MSDIEALAGTLRLHPGRPPPNIDSSRRALAQALAQGRPASALPDLLGQVFALCGGAHRVAARAAVGAAAGEAGAGHAADQALRLDTLRDQLRRVWLDWPRALGGAGADALDLAALRDCPALQRRVAPEAALAAMPAWVAQQALDDDPAAWLDRWDDDPAATLAAWCQRATTLPARLLCACRDAARQRARVAPLPLRVHADDAELAELAARLRADAGFALLPRWRGRPWETGPWTRLNQAAPDRFADAWMRLGSRLAEIVRLALPDAPGRAGALWLRHGRLQLAPREGLAWCEMARGLLVHRVELDDHREPRIVRCDVLAPTEWNFHPSGPVARAIAALAPAADEAPARLVATAFDPCVAVRIERLHA